MKNLAEFYNLKCEKSVQPMGSTSNRIHESVLLIYPHNPMNELFQYYLQLKIIHACQTNL